MRTENARPCKDEIPRSAYLVEGISWGSRRSHFPRWRIAFDDTVGKAFTIKAVTGFDL